MVFLCIKPQVEGSTCGLAHGFMQSERPLVVSCKEWFMQRKSFMQIPPKKDHLWFYATTCGFMQRKTTPT
jgi:hypothetical protein